MKKIIAITLACLMVFALCSTAFAEEAKSALPEGFKLGLCNINERGAFGLMVKMGFKDACEKRGWELIYADNNSDGPTGVSNAEIVAQKGAQFVVDLNVDASVGQVIMDIFNEANIPVLAVDIALPGAPFFGIDSPAMGYYNGEVMADWLKENKGGECDYVVLITQLASGDVVQERVRAAVKAFDDKGIKYGEVVEIEGQSDVAVIQQRFNDFLTAHPDAHNIVVFGINLYAGQGVVAAAETADRADDVKVFTCNVDTGFTDEVIPKEGNKLTLSLGYSHPVVMIDPEGITTEVPDATHIIVKGADKALVGNYAANIRKWRKPEPYKGKGIRYEGEYVRRKEGKTGK